MDGTELTTQSANLLSMFLLGLLGTGHCLGMCGPLVLALPGAGRGVVAHLAYHLGRITTYGVVGGVLATFGAGLRMAASGAGDDPLGAVTRLQVVLSLASAALLLALGLARLGVIGEPKPLALANPSQLPGFSRLRERASKGGAGPSIFLLGLVLGLLPCGLSYAAFARSLSADGPAWGMMLAVSFGLGTLPGLFALGTGAAAFARKHRRVFDLLAGVLLVAMALDIGFDAFAALR